MIALAGQPASVSDLPQMLPLLLLQSTSGYLQVFTCETVTSTEHHQAAHCCHLQQRQNK
jgi:hypothetical protein